MLVGGVGGTLAAHLHVEHPCLKWTEVGRRSSRVPWGFEFDVPPGYVAQPTPQGKILLHKAGVPESWPVNFNI